MHAGLFAAQPDREGEQDLDHEYPDQDLVAAVHALSSSSAPSLARSPSPSPSPSRSPSPSLSLSVSLSRLPAAGTSVIGTSERRAITPNPNTAPSPITTS